MSAAVVVHELEDGAAPVACRRRYVPIRLAGTDARDLTFQEANRTWQGLARVRERVLPFGVPFHDLTGRGPLLFEVAEQLGVQRFQWHCDPFQSRAPV